VFAAQKSLLAHSLHPNTKLKPSNMYDSFFITVIYKNLILLKRSKRRRKRDAYGLNQLF